MLKIFLLQHHLQNNKDIKCNHLMTAQDVFNKPSYFDVIYAKMLYLVSSNCNKDVLDTLLRCSVIKKLIQLSRKQTLCLKFSYYNIRYVEKSIVTLTCKNQPQIKNDRIVLLERLMINVLFDLR